MAGRPQRSFRLSLATSDLELIKRSAKELIALQPDLILCSSTPSTASLLQQTQTIPIIFANIIDPVASGLVASPQAREPNGGLIAMPDSFLTAHRVEVTSLAARHRLPALYNYRSFTEVGGLM